jgi:hypothetical protein
MTQRSTVAFAVHDEIPTLTDAARVAGDASAQLDLRNAFGGPTTTTYTAVDPISVHDRRIFDELARIPTEPGGMAGIAGAPTSASASASVPGAAEPSEPSEPSSWQGSPGGRRRFGELRPARAAEPAVATVPARPAPRAANEPTLPLRVRGSRPPQPRVTDAWIAQLAGLALEPAETEPRQLVEASTPMPARSRMARGSEELAPLSLGAGSGAQPARAGAPLSSTAPAYPLVAVAVAGPRGTAAAPALALPRRPLPAAERPIAWGRVVAAIALMSALIGVAVARLAYRPRAAAAAEAGARSAVAVLPFESRTSDPALRDAPGALARALADELAAQTVIEPAALRPGEAAPPAATLLRGSLADDPAGGVRLQIELVRPDAPPVTVLDRRAAPAELGAALRAGVPAFAGLLVDPRELPRYLELGRRALAEDRLPAALRHLRTILLHDPSHPGARLQALAYAADHPEVRALLAP